MHAMLCIDLLSFTIYNEGLGAGGEGDDRR